MFRSWIARNPSALAAAWSNAWPKDVFVLEKTLLAQSRAWGLRNAPTNRQQSQSHVERRKLAYMVQHGSVPIADGTVGMLLETAAKRWPDRELVVSIPQDVRLTFSEVLRRADRLAAGLISIGVKPGDRVGLWGPNDVEWIIGFMAAARAGFVTVAINPTYQMDEIIYAIQKVGVKVVISPENFKTQNYPRMLSEARKSCPTLEHVIIHSADHVTGTRRFADVEALPSRIEVERIAAEQEAISCHSGNNIQFTSGTTGRPKATMLSHRSLVNNSLQSAMRAELFKEQRVCLSVPFFHVFGTVQGLLSSTHVGSTLVVPSRFFNPVKSLEAILKEKCNVIYGTPTMWINIMDVHDRLRPPPINLSCGITGGSPMAPEVYKKIKETFHFENIKTIYGLTEATGVNFQSLPNESPELSENTIGHVADHVEVMVVDKNGKTVPFDVPGELWIRGYCTMLEYYADEQNTKKTFTEDGWLKTGDKFVLRSNGYGQIVGRLKDMLIRGGENIFPKEIEDILMTHPQILEVHVIGADDQVYGEEVCACVRLRDGANIGKEEVREYCKGRMAPFKIPRYVEFMQDFPKTASGKVQKFKLKKQLEDLKLIPS